MFTRAGFNKRFKPICHARIVHKGPGWVRESILVRFIPSGEYAWLGRGGISWPEHVVILTLREALPAELAESLARLPQSPLPQ